VFHLDLNKLSDQLLTVSAVREFQPVGAMQWKARSVN